MDINSKRTYNNTSLQNLQLYLLGSSYKNALNYTFAKQAYKLGLYPGRQSLETLFSLQYLFFSGFPYTVPDKSNGGGYATLFFVDSITVSRFGCLFTIPN